MKTQIQHLTNWQCNVMGGLRLPFFLYYMFGGIMEIMRYIVNKNSVITSNPGGGSSTMALYFADLLSTRYNVLYYNTDTNIDREFVKRFYPNAYENVFFMYSIGEHFNNYISELGLQLEYFDYIVIDTADTVGKKQLANLNMLFEMYDINLIATSQLRVNPGTGKPYSTVEEWNRQLSEKVFDNSIWIRSTTEPDKSVKRKYVDIYHQVRVGNKYEKRFLYKFDKKRGNII